MIDVVIVCYVGLVNLNPIEQYNSTITQLQSRDNLYITCLNYKYE